MNDSVNRRIVLAARPKGRPGPECFRLEEAALPAPGAGEMLARTIYLSLDPYMRGRMSEGPSYATGSGWPRGSTASGVPSRMMEAAAARSRKCTA
jgi:NADPH-dependent curcumin reductase CurA